MRIHFGTDHAGFEISKWAQEELAQRGYEICDHGPQEYDALDDYPAFCIAAAEAVRADEDANVPALGIVFGGSGNGEQIAANKVRGIRAALAWNLETASLAREHNKANVLSIGARQHSREEVLNIILTFLNATPAEEPRHLRRIGQIADYENAR